MSAIVNDEVVIDGWDAERYVLSSIMKKSDTAWEIFDTMSTSDFENPHHETIAKALMELVSTARPTDPIAVLDQLERTHDLGTIPDGDVYVLELFGYAPTWTNAAYYAELVRSRAQRRRMDLAGVTLRGLANDKAITADELGDRARALIDEAMGTSTSRSSSESAAEVADEVIANLGESFIAYPTPWPRLTGALRGLRPGALYILAARPALGKSALALQMAREVERLGTVGLITLEMPAKEVVRRMISQATLVPHSNLETGDLVGFMRDRVDSWLAEYRTSGRIQINARSGLTIADVRTQLRSWKRDHPDLKVVVIDYLQLISTPSGVPRNEAVSSLSRELKIMAGEFDIAIVALSQLNRNSEQRADKRPAMSDLRESGSLEQDADVVILLHRDRDSDDPEVEVIVAKNRHGPETSVWLDWHGEFMMAIES